MGQTTLQQAAQWIADSAGLNLEFDCDRVVGLVNDVRELIYGLSPIGWNVTLCVPVRCLCADCSGPCAGAYAGLSLPAYVNNVLAVWRDDRPMPVTDRWGIYPYDAEWQDATTNQAVDMGTGYPFLGDMPCDGSCFRMGFLARNKADAGKVLTLRYLDKSGINRREDIPLTDLWSSPKYPIGHIAAGGVTLPLGLKGNVIARMEDGTTLSEWEPWEIVPEYRRIKLPGLQCCAAGKMISVHAERRFVRLLRMSDVVETDKKLIWEDGYSHLMLHRKREGDGNDTQNAVKFITSFKAKLEIEARASWGKTKRVALRFVPASRRRSGLRGGQ